MYPKKILVQLLKYPQTLNINTCKPKCANSVDPRYKMGSSAGWGEIFWIG